MEFRIADTFSDSLARLTGEEQKAVKTTAFDLQMNPSSPGLQFHKLKKARDKNFWSVRVNADLRLIVHKTASSFLLCYVAHHDRAYDWAERRKLETHPKTGAAQLVEIRETVKEILIPVHREVEEPARAKPVLFVEQSDEELLGYGVPTEWLADVRSCDEDSLLTLADRLPEEAAEALLELATGGTPRIPVVVAPSADPFEHPDAQRRFRVMTNVEELERALDFPWDKWTVFLHPEQRETVVRSYNGPARVSGSAGTGKTIVALHRAVHLARTNPDARVLLATFSDTLAHVLQSRLKRLVGNEPRLGERIDVYSLDALGERLHKSHCGPLTLVDRESVLSTLRDASAAVGGHKFSLHFVMSEWEHVVDAWQLTTWDEYREVARLGRKTRLPETQRSVLWSIFERVRKELHSRKLTTPAGMFATLTTALATNRAQPFDYCVIDESQDISVSQLRFLAVLGRHTPDALFFAGDLGQRIFQQPFSWKSLGVDIRGRSRNLRINYRTSHQIRQYADRLLGNQLTDLDGVAVERNDTISVFNGPSPEIRVLSSERKERDYISLWLKEQSIAGCQPQEIGVFVRSVKELSRAQAAVAEAHLSSRVLDERVDIASGQVSISTMHMAKGLEFRVVVVMACDDEVIPLQERIETVGDGADLQEVYDTERHLLYVACTRARDLLLVTASAPASEFLDDLVSLTASLPTSITPHGSEQ